MHIVVTYDVNTETKEGRRRLRRVAKLCEDYGQRVQFSVFECTVDEMQMDAMLAALESEINRELDSLRIYRLHGKRSGAVRTLGKDVYRDFAAPMIV
ncbi:MAG: CRISPR-associated endonuclease Cas2 [Zetaproteobacteria bacterium CG06_land_8_20_14_3_00_59_53]|nr:MAG: CRISPR-associated endonuclease Cas2 [Zetaproteobacteria bacterium CG2_30_59_37]PIO90309.1 MAG: CRISPR-associated endonuclease Cas2 [Zetaproteobacteria bacterium CG23_combo_of_CG06-09_8_20_14_all_59_86]PIQ65884.1 MAG: CRISPR-associated endonuclease Cas2 [Zetaproteobacteria bacterium CG11_big_fil_rev_8_21_14_0_20_59_439]PIU70530.1 MAG: CRISPR-associated endonuclease Cas2 [Zetaproteobacteria bacterium CG06_land_8_20_14_3_00_59_53]PIU97605.1 MAG: CRISPR-associated endonuclease Cas2 [Zetapro